MGYTLDSRRSGSPPRGPFNPGDTRPSHGSGLRPRAASVPRSLLFTARRPDRRRRVVLAPRWPSRPPPHRASPRSRADRHERVWRPDWRHPPEITASAKTAELHPRRNDGRHQRVHDRRDRSAASCRVADSHQWRGVRRQGCAAPPLADVRWCESPDATARNPRAFAAGLGTSFVDGELHDVVSGKGGVGRGAGLKGSGPLSDNARWPILPRWIDDWLALVRRFGAFIGLCSRRVDECGDSSRDLRDGDRRIAVDGEGGVKAVQYIRDRRSGGPELRGRRRSNRGSRSAGQDRRLGL